MLPATVGLVHWKMITYCVPNDKSAQWHVALLSSPDPSLIVSVVSFLCPACALICWNDSPHIRGTNRMPSASLSLSSLSMLTAAPNAPSPLHHPLLPPSSFKRGGNQRSLRLEGKWGGGAENVVWGQGSVSAVWVGDIIAARYQQHTSSNTLLSKWFWVIIRL